MPHVEQRLLVHRLVFERRVDRFATTHRRVCTPFQVEHAALERIDDQRVGARAERQHFVARGPDGGGAAARHGGRLGVGIDAAREQLFEPLVRRRARPRPSLDQRDQAERRQMPFIEHDRVAQRDRPSVVRGRIDQIEERRETASRFCRYQLTNSPRSIMQRASSPPILPLS